MILNYSDYREFIKAYIAQLPKKGRGEIGKMAKHMNVSSTLFSQALAGDKQLSQEQCYKLSEYLGLTALEADYFLCLLQVDRAGTKELKDYYIKKSTLIKSEGFKLSNRVIAKKNLSEEEKSVFYSSALFSAIRLYTSTSIEGKGLDEITSRFDLSRSKTISFLQFLNDAGLIVEENGKYKMGPQSTHLESTSRHLHKHHANWRLRSTQYSEDLSDSELMYTAPVSISKRDFDVLREQMVEFIKKFLKQVHDSPAEEVACFNLDWFWIRK
jgi:uncharacterized protein (TIGR02147 family)